jgi:hypothetical protein
MITEFESSHEVIPHIGFIDDLSRSAGVVAVYLRARSSDGLSRRSGEERQPRPPTPPPGDLALTLQPPMETRPIVGRSQKFALQFLNRSKG